MYKYKAITFRDMLKIIQDMPDEKLDNYIIASNIRNCDHICGVGIAEPYNDEIEFIIYD